MKKYIIFCIVILVCIACIIGIVEFTNKDNTSNNQLASNSDINEYSTQNIFENEDNANGEKKYEENPTKLIGKNNKHANQSEERRKLNNLADSVKNASRDYPNTNKPDDVNASAVYFTKNITPEGLIAVYEALGRKAEGKVAVKIASGEPPSSNYLRPELIGDFVKLVNGTIVETNTAVGGARSNTAYHYQVAKDHGFNKIANFQVLDENGSIGLKVTGGKHLKENLVGAHFKDYDFQVVLSHFKGHLQGGFGGAIKNSSIGYASSTGKNRIHTAGEDDTGWIAYGSAKQDDFLESMAEATKSVVDYCGDNILFINVMNRLSIDCDCVGYPDEPTMADIGILASTDPVALDKACVDLVYAAPDGQDIIDRITALNGTHTLDYAEEIGLGSKTYRLVNIDD